MSGTPYLVLESAESASTKGVWALVGAGDDLLLGRSGGGRRVGGRHNVHVLLVQDGVEIHGEMGEGRRRRKRGVLVVGGRGVTYWD